MSRELMDSASAVRAAARRLDAACGGAGGIGLALRAAYRGAVEADLPADMQQLVARLDGKGPKR